MKEIDLFEKFYEFYKNDDWENAKNELLTVKEDYREGFWYYSRLSSVYHELREYEKALHFADIAYSINPDSPLVLWDKAGALYSLERAREAIVLWKKILSMDTNDIAFVLSREGLEWAKSLKNGCRYSLADAYYIIREDEKALVMIEEHLNNREKGLWCNHTEWEALKLKYKILSSSDEDE